MLRGIIAVVAILVSATIFTPIGMWIAPYAVGVFKSNITYNIILGVILALLTIAFIALLCKKRLRIYSLILAPHIIALSFVMLYVGNKIRYIGDGHIKIESPFSRESKIKTISGRVVFDDASGISLNRISSKTLFVKRDYDSIEKVYDYEGVCILIRPSDDTWMEVARDAICTGKDLTKDGDNIHRVRIRIFSLAGEYMATRLYATKFLWSNNWNLYSKGEEHLKEYTEEVVVLEDGVKVFNQNDDNSQRAETDEKNIENVMKLSTLGLQPRERVRSGHWEYKECPTCHGYGKHRMVDCRHCLEYDKISREWGGSYQNFKCFACGGTKQVNCPNSRVELKKYVYD